MNVEPINPLSIDINKMSNKVKVLIAYNNDISESSRQFFDNCATDIRNYCIEKGFEYQILIPPHLVEQKLMETVLDSQICYIASHGRPDGIENEKKDDIISTQTTNYNLNGKALFAVSCYCAQILKDELMRIGLKLFVGYKSEYVEFPGYDEFHTTANSGVKIFIEGATVSEMRAAMYKSYDECLDLLYSESPIVADGLLDNRENLIIEGHEQLCLSDL